jgi:hypothetical protein
MSYLEEVKQDVKTYCEDNEQFFDFSDYADADDFEQDLNEKLWVEDSVTGNASGSYHFNREESKEMVLENIAEVTQALEEFGQLEELGKKMAEDEWEFLDVSARCYFLGQAIAEYIEENKEEIEKAIEQANE